MVIEKLSTELSQLIEQSSKSIVLVEGRRFPSSGIVWQKNLVVTADHTLPRVEELQLRTSSGEVVTATVAGRDPATDTAFLRTTTDLPPIESAPQEQIKTGQLAVTIGRANGGRLLSILSMISGTDERYRNWRGGTLDRFIRLDIAPFPGFSGSALLLPNGKIAGMNTAVFSRHFGLTIPASNIERLLQRLSTKGSIAKPYLGLMMQPIRLPEKMRQLAEIGLLLVGTEDASPAEQAGLLIGDIVVRLNEKTVNSMEELQDLLTQESIGKEVKVGFIRGGKVQELTVVVGERPLRKRNE